MAFWPPCPASQRWSRPQLCSPLQDGQGEPVSTGAQPPAPPRTSLSDVGGVTSAPVGASGTGAGPFSSQSHWFTCLYVLSQEQRAGHWTSPRAVLSWAPAAALGCPVLPPTPGSPASCQAPVPLRDLSGILLAPVTRLGFWGLQTRDQKIHRGVRGSIRVFCNQAIGCIHVQRMY